MAPVNNDKPTNRPFIQDPVEYWLEKATETPQGCLITPACQDKDGYPLVWKGGKTGKLHRLSRLILEKQLHRPLTAFALHTCDNSACVNPNHLYEGTQQRNRIDAKLRNRTAKGANNGKPRKLSQADVLAIRHRVHSGEHQQTVAAAFGVHQVTISKIVNRKSWAWL